jgi:hypothetical protein
MLKVKIVSLWQPYASAIALGLKQYETRTWLPHKGYRGLLAIHAAQRPIKAEELGDGIFTIGEAFAQKNIGLRDLPLGCIVALGFMDECFPSEVIRGELSPMELAFGDYGDGRYGWRISRLIGFKKPIAAIGRQSMWDWAVPNDYVAAAHKLVVGDEVPETNAFWYIDHRGKVNAHG